MRRPSSHDMELAASWLDMYEEHGGDLAADACVKVAKWLRDQADAQELRDAAKGAGVSMRQARRAIKISNHS